MKNHRRASLFTGLWLAVGVSLPVQAQQPVPPSANPAVDVAVNQQLIDQVLNLLSDVVITKLDARLSLEKAAVDSGRVRLNGVRLEKLGIGLRVNSRGARKLGAMLGPRLPAEWGPVLEVIRLGLFESVEVDLSLKELYLQELSIDAEGLNIEGALAYAGVTPPDPVTGKPRGDSLESLMRFLRNTAMNRVKLHAGLDYLAAKRAKIRLQGVGLDGLHVGVSLRREAAQTEANNSLARDSTGSK